MVVAGFVSLYLGYTTFIGDTHNLASASGSNNSGYIPPVNSGGSGGSSGGSNNNQNTNAPAPTPTSTNVTVPSISYGQGLVFVYVANHYSGSYTVNSFVWQDSQGNTLSSGQMVDTSTAMYGCSVLTNPNGGTEADVFPFLYESGSWVIDTSNINVGSKTSGSC